MKMMIFKRHQHTVSAQRTRLKADTIGMLECLKSRFRTGIYAQQDLHEIVAAENVGLEVELELEGSDDSKLIFSCADSLYQYVLAQKQVLVSHVYQPSTAIHVPVFTGTGSETNCLYHRKP